MNHRDVVIRANLKQIIVNLYGAQKEAISTLVNLVHVFGDGHGTENFRGCTHDDCDYLREWLKEMEK